MMKGAFNFLSQTKPYLKNGKYGGIGGLSLPNLIWPPCGKAHQILLRMSQKPERTPKIEPLPGVPPKGLKKLGFFFFFFLIFLKKVKKKP